MGPKLLPLMTLGSSGPIVSFGPSIISQMLAVTSTHPCVTSSLPATTVSRSRICRNHKFRGFAGIGLLYANEVKVTLCHERRTNADGTIGSHIRDPLIYASAAQHADP
jgi:hypothetical protein